MRKQRVMKQGLNGIFWSNGKEEIYKNENDGQWNIERHWNNQTNASLH